MFTGIIQAIGKIAAIELHSGDARLRINSNTLDLADTRLGDSIAVNGVCLTVVDVESHGFSADVSAETLACTTVGGWRSGEGVNLEKALTATCRLGGHLVSGHVDGVGDVLERQQQARSVRLCIQAPTVLARYIATKGSICIDGVSLTVNLVDGTKFEVNIVPHTLQATTLQEYRVGTRVNLEVDVIARYLERLMMGKPTAKEGASLTKAFLAEHGVLKL